MVDSQANFSPRSFSNQRTLFVATAQSVARRKASTENVDAVALEGVEFKAGFDTKMSSVVGVVLVFDVSSFVGAVSTVGVVLSVDVTPPVGVAGVMLMIGQSSRAASPHDSNTSRLGSNPRLQQPRYPTKESMFSLHWLVQFVLQTCANVVSSTSAEITSSETPLRVCTRQKVPLFCPH